MEILAPATSGPIGPGMFVRAQSSFVGPLPVGSFWEARILPATGERALAQGRFVSQLNPAEFVLGEFFSSETSFSVLINPQESSTPHGAAARLEVSLSTPTGGVVDTTTIPVIYDAQTGVQWIAGQTTGGTVTGGFTSADRLILEAVQAAVSMSVPGVGLLQLVNLIANLPPSFHGRELITPDRTGDGTLTRPGGPLGVNASGLYWEIVGRAPGIGMDEGAPDVTEIRSLELRFVLQLADGTKFTDEHRQYAEGNAAWIWGSRTPVQIDYNITPGVSIRFWWLLVGAGAWLPGSVPLELFLPRSTPLLPH